MTTYKGSKLLLSRFVQKDRTAARALEPRALYEVSVPMKPEEASGDAPAEVFG